MHAVILGAGAVGGYLGARLMSAGDDVTFLARDKRVDELAARGLVVKSPLGDFAGPVKVVAAGSTPTSAVDIILLACKEPSLAEALDAVTPVLGPETRLLPLLNGMRHLDMLAERYPRTPLLSGIVHGGLELRADGVIEHLTPTVSVIIGPTAAASDPIADALVKSLVNARVDARVSADIRHDMWDKFVFIATMAGITCLMRASIGTIIDTEAGRDMPLRLLDECDAVARAEGYPPSDAAMRGYRELLTKSGSTITSSMLRDIKAGRSTEGDHILGDMLRRARRHQLPAPLLAVAAANLEAYEKRRAQRA